MPKRTKIALGKCILTFLLQQFTQYTETIILNEKRVMKVSDPSDYTKLGAILR